MEIRAFVNADRERVVELWRQCDLVRPWNDPNRDIDRKVAVNDGLFLVGELDGTIVATAMAGYDGHRGWVNYLAVDPERQGNGLGAELMADIEARLVGLGCPKLNLQIRTDNEGAIAFYERIGFSVDAALSMGKRLISDVEPVED